MPLSNEELAEKYEKLLVQLASLSGDLKIFTMTMNKKLKSIYFLGLLLGVALAILASFVAYEKMKKKETLSLRDLEGYADLKSKIIKDLKEINDGHSKEEVENFFAEDGKVDQMIKNELAGYYKKATAMKDLEEYLKTNDFDSIIRGYLTNQNLRDELGDYLKNTDLNQILDSYTKKDDLNTSLFTYTKKSDLKPQVLAFSNEIRVPIGTILPFYGVCGEDKSENQIPEGFLLCDGSQISAKKDEEYKAIFEHLKNADPSLVVRDDEIDRIIKLPDLQGMFLRGLDSRKKVDPDDRVLGGKQDDSTKKPNIPFTTSDAIPNHIKRNTHLHWDRSKHKDNLGRGKIEPKETSFSISHTHKIDGGDSETRPKNIAVNFIIKY